MTIPATRGKNSTWWFSWLEYFLALKDLFTVIILQITLFFVVRNYFKYKFPCWEKIEFEGSFAIKAFHDLKIKKWNYKGTTIKIIEHMCFQWKSMWRYQPYPKCNFLKPMLSVKVKLTTFILIAGRTCHWMF